MVTPSRTVWEPPGPALREFRIRDYHENGIIRPYWCPGNYNVADFFSELLEKGLFTMHAYRFGMNFQV